MSFSAALVLVASAMLGGALNSVAGGGSFFTFPALVFCGTPPLVANATSAVALWPAALAASVAYRGELASSRRIVLWFASASAVGGAIGAVFLLRTPSAMFARAVPYLLFTAAMIFTFGRRFARKGGGSPTSGALLRGSAIQLAISVYGGYFGGGMGIVMLAALSLIGMTNIHAMNSLKVLLGTIINFVAIALFITAGVVAWEPSALMIAAATCGGYLGARAARRLDPSLVRHFVLFSAWTMTVVFFWKVYG